MLREDNSNATATAPETLEFFNCTYPFASEIFLSASDRKHMNRPIVLGTVVAYCLEHRTCAQGVVNSKPRKLYGRDRNGIKSQLTAEL